MSWGCRRHNIASKQRTPIDPCVECEKEHPSHPKFDMRLPHRVTDVECHKCENSFFKESQNGK